jgi:hypothetical protein
VGIGGFQLLGAFKLQVLRKTITRKRNEKKRKKRGSFVLGNTCHGVAKTSSSVLLLLDNDEK